MSRDSVLIRNAALLLGVVTLVLLAASCQQPFSWLRSTRHALLPSAATAGLATGTATSGRLFSGERARTYAGTGLFGDRSAAQPQPFNHVGMQSAKWAVVTTIFKPSQQLIDTLALPGWAMVVVGDKGAAPFDLAAPNLVYLGVADQEALGHQFPGLLELLPWRHFGRKNLGFLYAIAHGAEMIWDFDDDNGLKPGIVPTVPTLEVYDVQVAPNCESFNPYPHMGAPEAEPGAWPRGYPLSLIKHSCNHTLATGSSRSVAVVQSLADHEPDVDGIFRLTRTIPFDFSSSSKHTLVLPAGVLTPYNAQATLVLQPALFTQLLPVTVHGRVTDIWRSYIAQRLLWDVGHRIAFAPPMVTQIRNPHNPLADMQSEEQLYYQSLVLVQRLREWQGKAPTIAGRFEELVIDLYERGYIELGDVELTQQWLLALQAVGYRFPPLASSQGVHHHQKQQEHQPVKRKTAAVCVSGQLRTANMTIPKITSNLFTSALAGSYDVFVFLQSRGTAQEPHVGNPHVSLDARRELQLAMSSQPTHLSAAQLCDASGIHAQHVAGCLLWLQACDVFKRPEHPDAQVFCRVVQEQPLNVSEYMPPTVQNKFIYAGREKQTQGVVQQLLGLQGCLRMAEAHSASSGVQYDNIVRLRPDNEIFDPIPSLATLVNESTTLFYPDPAFKCCGNEDSFSISSWDVGRALFNRVDRLSDAHFSAWAATIDLWTAEGFLIELCKHLNITMRAHPDIHVHVMRPPGRPIGGTSDP